MGENGENRRRQISTVYVSRSGDRMDDRSAPMELGLVEPIGTTNFSIKNDKSPNARIALIGLD